MKYRPFLVLVCLFSMLSTTAYSSGKTSDFQIFPSFAPGREYFSCEKKRIHVGSENFDKPITNFEVYFHFVPRIGPSGFPILDMIITVKRPCSDVKESLISYELKEIKLDETNSKYLMAGQIFPNSSLWQIRDKNGKVVRQWEPDFNDWLRCDGDHHFGTTVWLPNDDLKNSFLLLYFKDINGDGNRDDVVFEIELRDLQWSKLRKNF